MNELASFASALGGWWVGSIAPITAWTGLMLVAAGVGVRLLARRVRASLRLALYAAVPLRMALPADWTTPLGLFGARAAGRGAVHASTEFAFTAGSAATRAWDWHAALGLAYVVVA